MLTDIGQEKKTRQKQSLNPKVVGNAADRVKQEFLGSSHESDRVARTPPEA